MQASHAQTIRSGSLSRPYEAIRATTLKIAQPFSAEDQMLQSMPDASPMKWHLAHTTWFFETFISSAKVSGYRPFDPRYRQLFNSYYKQLGSHPYRGARGLMSRPSLEEVLAYRKWVDAAMQALIGDASGDASDEVAGLIELGLNHEQQHQELMLTDIKHALWSMPLRPQAEKGPRSLHEAPMLRLTAVPGGIYQIGHAGEGFAFDNEGPRHPVLLEDFQIASRPVTNAEYLDFMRDQGYERPELWLSDGWEAVCQQKWNAPLYWEQSDSVWFEFSFAGIREIDLAAPVCHVSYYEADAFARWSGARLPREEEWEVAVEQVGSAQNGAFLEDWRFTPAPSRNEGPQWFGNVWEWTSSPYVAYPGFAPAPGAIGEYNGKFMCNQFVLRGGSCATPQSHIRSTYRNFFPPHARWQFMGIRLAK
jgi:ergothioneine biosynthesis protein EgtB